MTCVVALEALDGAGRPCVWLGSDSFMGDDEHRDTVDGPKWFAFGPAVLGYAGAFAPARIAQHAVKAPQRARGEPDESYVLRLALAVQKGCNDFGVKPDDGWFLVAMAGRVWSIEAGGAPVRSAHGYTAIGAGAQLALAALAATGACPLLAADPEARVRVVLDAVARHHNQVLGPMHVRRVPTARGRLDTAPKRE